MVASFDGAAKPEKGGGSCSAIIWSFPSWTVVRAMSRFIPEVTVNEAEYHGIRLVMELVLELDIKELVVCGNSNLVIRQLRGEMECRAVNLQLLKREVEMDLHLLQRCDMVHVKREWNAAADMLASSALSEYKLQTPIH
jgi:ribonuclease HI